MNNFFTKKRILRKKKYAGGLTIPAVLITDESAILEKNVDKSVNIWYNLCITWDKSVKNETIHNPVDR